LPGWLEEDHKKPQSR